MQPRMLSSVGAAPPSRVLLAKVPDDQAGCFCPCCTILNCVRELPALKYHVRNTLCRYGSLIIQLLKGPFTSASKADIFLLYQCSFESSMLIPMPIIYVSETHLSRGL